MSKRSVHHLVVDSEIVSASAERRNAVTLSKALVQFEIRLAHYQLRKHSTLNPFPRLFRLVFRVILASFDQLKPFESFIPFQLVPMLN